jgi:glutamate decarboxylase
LRVVVRNGFSRDLADLLVTDLRRHVDYLSRLTEPLPRDESENGFHH